MVVRAFGSTLLLLIGIGLFTPTSIYLLIMYGDWTFLWFIAVTTVALYFNKFRRTVQGKGLPLYDERGFRIHKEEVKE